MTLPYPDPAALTYPNPYFQDNAFVRGDQARGNNQFIFGNLAYLEAKRPQPGSVIMFAGPTPPPQWLECDGSAVSRTTYADLFAAIGVTWGIGDGATTFNLPDFRGIFPKGSGTTTRASGKDASGNAYSGSLGTYAQDRFQGHKMSQRGNTNPAFAAGSAIKAADGANLTDLGVTGNPVSDDVNGTPRTGHTTEPQSAGINFIIAY